MIVNINSEVPMKPQYSDDQFQAYCEALLYYRDRVDSPRFKPTTSLSPWTIAAFLGLIALFGLWAWFAPDLKAVVPGVFR
jgi:hypothetical protein